MPPRKKNTSDNVPAEKKRGRKKKDAETLPANKDETPKTSYDADKIVSRALSMQIAFDQLSKKRSEDAKAGFLEYKRKELSGRCLYTEEIGAEICARVLMGEPLAQIARDEHMPHVVTILKWLKPSKMEEGSVPEEILRFKEAYTTARVRRLELEIDELTLLSDVATNQYDANAIKLRINTRQWMLERMRASEFAPIQREPSNDDAGSFADKLEGALAIIHERRSRRLGLPAPESEAAQGQAESQAGSCSSKSKGG